MFSFMYALHTLQGCCEVDVIPLRLQERHLTLLSITRRNVTILISKD